MKVLIHIQNELKVPKGNFNSFGKYRYRSAEDILEALKPILKKYDAALTVTDDIVQIGERFFLKATAVITFLTDKPQGLSFPSAAVCGFAELSEHKGMSAEQATGTASSYARKYALNGLFLIDETEADADSQPKQERKDTFESVARESKERAAKENLSTLERIRNAEKAIRDLGGEVESFNPTGKNQEDMKEELAALTQQYNRLKNK